MRSQSLQRTGLAPSGNRRDPGPVSMQLPGRENPRQQRPINVVVNIGEAVERYLDTDTSSLTTLDGTNYGELGILDLNAENDDLIEFPCINDDNAGEITDIMSEISQPESNVVNTAEVSTLKL